MVVSLRFQGQRPNLFQTAILTFVIKAIADDEFIGDPEAGPVGLDRNFVTAALFEEDADFHVGGAKHLQARGEGGEGAAGVEDVVDDEDVAARQGFSESAQAGKAVQLAGALGARVAGQPEAGDFRVEVHGAEKIGEEEERAIHDAEEEEALVGGPAPAVMAGDAPAELPDARADLRLREQDAAGLHEARKRRNRPGDKLNSG